MFLHQEVILLYSLDTVDDVGELRVLDQGGEGRCGGGTRGGLEKKIHQRGEVAADLTGLLFRPVWSENNQFWYSVLLVIMIK